MTISLGDLLIQRLGKKEGVEGMASVLAATNGRHSVLKLDKRKPFVRHHNASTFVAAF